MAYTVRSVADLAGVTVRTLHQYDEVGLLHGQGAMFEGFDDSKMRAHAEQYKEEARELYGKDMVDESYRRASKFTKEDWADIKAEENDIMTAVAARMDKGPADPVVQEKMVQKFKLINDRYYACTAEVFRGLGTLYVNDDRFKANYEAVKPGLAEFMRDAMAVYSDKLEGKC